MHICLYTQQKSPLDNKYFDAGTTRQGYGEHLKTVHVCHCHNERSMIHI